MNVMVLTLLPAHTFLNPNQSAKSSMLTMSSFLLGLAIVLTFVVTAVIFGYFFSKRPTNSSDDEVRYLIGIEDDFY